MTNKISFWVYPLFCISLTAPLAHAVEGSGPLEFYRGGAASTYAHLKVRGDAARLAYEHLKKASETHHREQQVWIRRGPQMECAFFETEPRERYVCYFHLDDRGSVGAGYAP